MRLLLISIYWCENQYLNFLVLCASNSVWSFPTGALKPPGHEPSMSNPIKTSEDSETVVGATTKLSLNESESLSLISKSTIAESLLSQQSDQSVIDFLGKPVYIGSGNLTNLTPRNSLQFTTPTGGLLTFIDVWNQKLKGFYNIKATAVYDIIINASPFHQGALLVNYMPCKNRMPMSYAMRGFNLMNTSQWPGSMICNINKDHYRLEIPYVSVQEMYPIRDGDAMDWGDMHVWCWSPLETGAAGLQTITFAVWLSWKDVELGAPYPQALGGRRAPIIKRSVPQSESNEGKGPISSIFSSVSRATGELASIPGLSGVMGTVGWASAILSKSFSAFGYSKPIISDSIKRVTSLLHHYTTNSIGFDNSAMLCATADACVQVIDGKTIYPHDEMSIDFIKTRPAYYTNITLSTGQAVGTQVTSIPLAPNTFNSAVTYDGVGYTQYTPIGLLGQLFYYYTGSITLKFKFFKTAFHAGQFMISFAPRSPGALSLNATAPLHREFIDLQTLDEIEVTFPYTLAQPFNYVWDNYGTVYFHVVTPLRAPESVSQSIDVTIEVVGATDLKFANPKSDVPLPIIAQGAIDLEEESSTMTTNVGTSSLVSKPLDMAQVSIGEQIESIKQLLLRPTRIQILTAMDFNTNATFWFRPSLMTAVKRVSPGTYQRPDFYGSLVDKLAFCYAFNRGGHRWRFFDDAGTQLGSILSNMWYNPPNSNLSDFGNAAYGPSISYSSNAATTYSYLSHNLTSFPPKEGGAAIEVPHMSLWPIAPNEPSFSGALAGFSSSSVVTMRCNTAKSTYITRAVSDDFQFLFWIGVPLMYPDSV